MLGILNINKPKGITSHDVVSRTRRALNTRRVGHAGTLDPLATGVLVVAVGPATRFLQYLPLEPKVYHCQIRFGFTSNTYDAEGELIQGSPVPSDLTDALVNTLPSYVGEVEQLPPMYSAVKKDGKPLYVLARQGIEVERQLRKIYIDEIVLGEVKDDIAEMTVTCSGGTYVRTLADDLGKSIGCGAYLAELKRTRVGNFDISESVELDNVSLDKLMPLSSSLGEMEQVKLNEAQVMHVQHGQPVQLRHETSAEKVALVGPNGIVIGIASVKMRWAQPECVIPLESLAEIS